MEIPQLIPDGFDVEIFKFKALKESFLKSKKPSSERARYTLYKEKCLFFKI